jgi:hypothetical protein
MTPPLRVSDASVTSFPSPGEARRLIGVLQQHPHWSVFYDKRHRLWRAAEDDPDSDLYAESSDVDTVIGYITAHC